MRQPQGRYLAACGLLLAANVATWAVRERRSQRPRVTVLDAVLPASLAGWPSIEMALADEHRVYLGADVLEGRRYEMANRPIEVIVVAGTDWRNVHSPQNCLRSTGWEIIAVEERTVRNVPGLRGPLRLAVVLMTQEHKRRVAAYTFLFGPRSTTGWVRQCWRVAWGRGRPGALLQLTTAATGDGAEVEAELTKITAAAAAVVVQRLATSATVP